MVKQYVHTIEIQGGVSPPLLLRLPAEPNLQELVKIVAALLEAALVIFIISHTGYGIGEVFSSRPHTWSAGIPSAWLRGILSIEYLVGVPSSEVVVEWVWVSDKETPVALSAPTSLCSVH